MIFQNPSITACRDSMSQLNLPLISFYQETIPATKKKTKGATNTKLTDQPSLPHENARALDLDVITPYLRRSYQQKGVVTSTPADGIVPVNPSDHMGAPTPILPAGHSSSSGLPGKRTAIQDKQKSLVVFKKASKAKGMLYLIIFKFNKELIM